MFGRFLVLFGMIFFTFSRVLVAANPSLLWKSLLGKEWWGEDRR